MPPPSSSVTQADDWMRRGSAAVDAQDLAAAKKCFERAVHLDSDNADRRFHLAIVLESLKDVAGAAGELTEALRIKPSHLQAMRRLAALVARQALPEDVRLNRRGLRAALRQDAGGREAIAEAAIRYLSLREPLRGALDLGRSKGWEATARTLLVKRTGALLRDDVLLELLCTGIVQSIEVERLLTALRRVLTLEVVPQRFADRELTEFAIALLQQCCINEYVWLADEDELGTIANRPVDVSRLLAGNVEQGHSFLLASLYGPAYKSLGAGVSAESVGKIRPKALADAVGSHVAAYVDEQARMARLPRLGDLADDTSRKVALQYEAAPYPRWTRLALNQKDGEFRADMGQYFKPEQLAFMDQPFAVLVAGCGTGAGAIQLALGHGSNAQILALDLSASSLAYGWRMADRFGARNVKFMQADIQQIGSFPELHSRFQIIECAGVLHHMADTFAGWRALMQCLAPGGLMRIALYSATARSKLTALRDDPAYPGPGCDDAKLRAFRRLLMERPDGDPGSELKSSLDFYATSGFRDLVLNVSERCHSISELAGFFKEAGLAFRGFWPSFDFNLLRERSPHETWPGSLEGWTELEQAFPVLFTRMYTFWCERV